MLSNPFPPCVRKCANNEEDQDPNETDCPTTEKGAGETRLVVSHGLLLFVLEHSWLLWERTRHDAVPFSRIVVKYGVCQFLFAGRAECESSFGSFSHVW